LKNLGKIYKFNWEILKEFTLLFNLVNYQTCSNFEFDTELMQQYLSSGDQTPENNCLLLESCGELAGYLYLEPETSIGRVVLNLGMQKKFGQNHNLMIPLLDTGILCAKSLRIKKIHVPQILRLVPLDKILLDRGFKKIRTYKIMRCFKKEISKPEVPIGFRNVTLKDIYNIEKFVELQNQSFSGSWGFSPNNIRDIEFQLNMKNTEPEDILILEKEGDFVAYIWLSKSITGTRKAWIRMTGVLPEYRGYGFGKYILQQGLYKLIPNQYNVIELNVDSSNLTAINMYRNMGFKSIDLINWYELEL